MPAVSLRQFASQQGWNPGYAHKLKVAGRLVMVRDGEKDLVDVDASLARIAASADPAKQHMGAVNAQQRAVHRGTATPPALPRPLSQPLPAIEGARAGTGDSRNATYMQAKTAREVYEAKNAQLEYEERIGKLIKADAVRAAWAARITTTRDALLQIPARLAPVLAAESDLARVTELLEAELRQALAELSRERESGVAL